MAYEQELHYTILLKSQFHQMLQSCNNSSLRVNKGCPLVVSNWQELLYKLLEIEASSSMIVLSLSLNKSCNINNKCLAFVLIGIVVGAWPCGTVVMVGELFGAESKSQVYGNIHTFLQENEQATDNLGMSSLFCST